MQKRSFTTGLYKPRYPNTSKKLLTKQAPYKGAFYAYRNASNYLNRALILPNDAGVMLVSGDIPSRASFIIVSVSRWSIIQR